MLRPRRILLAGGGSGGSATPVIAVAQRLREHHPACELLLVGTEDGPERQLADAAGLNFAAVPSGKLRRYWDVKNLTDPFKVLAGCVAAARLVRRFRASVAFGAGGFASVPPLAAAAALGVPVHIHQQDVIPGLANRLLVPVARSISVSMSQSLPRFPAPRTVLVGNPVRPAMLEGCADRAVARFHLDPNLSTVLVTGGGTGALGLNRLVARAAPALVQRCQIVHLTGRGRGVPIERELPRYHQVEFVAAEMADLLAAATLVVSRAGMGTLAELSVLGKPTILIPMPRSHQLANAQAFAASGAVCVLDQDELTHDSLVTQITSLLDDPARLGNLATSIRDSMPPDAADRLADMLIELAG